MKVTANFAIERGSDEWLLAAVDSAALAARLERLRPVADIEECVGSVTTYGGARAQRLSLARLSTDPAHLLARLQTLNSSKGLENFSFSSPTGDWNMQLNVYEPNETRPRKTGVFNLSSRHSPDYDDQVTTEVFALMRCLTGLSPASGGVIPEIDHHFGAYAHAAAAGWDTFDETFSGEHVVDYCWLIFLPPRVVKLLGGLEVVADTAPVERIEGHAWSHEAKPGAIACVATNPYLVEPNQWRRWRDYLKPVLPVHTGGAKTLGLRPMHILEEDWIQPSADEIRRSLGL